TQFGPQDLVRLTEPGGGHIRLAVVFKPCESRAVVELVKLNQIELDHVILIVPDCPGTVELKDYSKVANGEDVPNRFACGICRAPVGGDPVDITLGTFGVGDGEVFLTCNTEKGTEFANAIGAKGSAIHKDREKALKKALEEGVKAYKEQEALSREKFSDITAMLGELGTCIKCMNCMEVCPVCYCKECLLKTDAFNPTAMSLADKAKRRGTIRMPVETAQFHLVRMAHVMTACVMCGQCQSACPSEIPLVEMYAGINQRIQAQFDYEAGRSVDEEPPFTCFREQEGFEVGN
ncbi:MAG: 4Fe-4S dicluster domain-containing protein, partial [Candidatus Thermoplasmatota archaeon]|nr:4Fe-4S dicluster domain-containing protein [Candidatus Thermoplasmatota archaeon]